MYAIRSYYAYFLFTGILVDRIYDWADAVADRFTGVQVVAVPYLRDHPRVIETFMERLQDIARDTLGSQDRLAQYRAWNVITSYSIHYTKLYDFPFFLGLGEVAADADLNGMLHGVLSLP